MEGLFKDIKNYFYIKKNEVLTMAIIEIMAIVIGEIILAFVLNIGRTSEDYIQFGCMMSIIAMLFIMFFMSIKAARDFTLMLSMGITRKRFFTVKLIYETIIAMLLSLLVYVIYFAGKGIHKLIYSFVDFSMAYDMGVILRPGYAVLFACALLLLCQIMTIVFIRFKQFGFIVLWLVWMLVFTMAPRVIPLIYESNNEVVFGIMKMLNMYHGLGYGLAGVVALVIGALISYRLLLRQQVSI